MIDREAVIEKARTRLAQTLPGAQDVTFYDTERGTLLLSMTLDEAHHTIRLRRNAGIWKIREWVVNHRTQHLNGKSPTSPRFDALIKSLVGYDDKHPTVELIELRCPVDPRRMFGKIFVQRPTQEGVRSLLEFSCSQCKRTTGEITKHYFDSSGELVKTDQHGPWIKREPDRWFTRTQASQQSSEEVKAK